MKLFIQNLTAFLTPIICSTLVFHRNQQSCSRTCFIHFSESRTIKSQNLHLTLYPKNFSDIILQQGRGTNAKCFRIWKVKCFVGCNLLMNSFRPMFIWLYFLSFAIESASICSILNRPANIIIYNHKWGLLYTTVNNIISLLVNTCLEAPPKEVVIDRKTRQLSRL